MLSERNPHPRDRRIQRIGEIWYIDGNKCIQWGGTRRLEPYFPNEFDADKVYGNDTARRKAAEQANLLACKMGIFLSKCAENFYNGLEFEPDPFFPNIKSLDFPEWHSLRSLMSTLPSSWVPWRVEWPLYSTRIQTIAVADMILRDMAFPNQYRFIVLDFKCQKDPRDIPFCKSWLKNEAERTNCNRSKHYSPLAHEERCSAVAKRCLRSMFATKIIKCGAQMAIERKILLEMYTFDKPVICDKMVGVFIKPQYAKFDKPQEDFVHYYDQQDIDLYEPMIEEIILTRKNLTQ